MLTHRIMQELIALMGDAASKFSGHPIRVQAVYLAESVILSINPQGDKDRGILPHLWIADGSLPYANVYFRFALKGRGFHLISHEPSFTITATTGKEAMSQWPENTLPSIRPWFSLMLDIYDIANPA